jgi:division protein CdvB (Snf7/Vps24/ESCRT-III family)
MTLIERLKAIKRRLRSVKFRDEKRTAMDDVVSAVGSAAAGGSA